MHLPVSEDEQQKIAIFLATLDDKITAEKSKLTASRQFKKALLQRMFV
jgi:restriction endonuclease S subunit